MTFKIILYFMNNISLCVDYFLHRAKEGDRKGYIERYPHNLEREASMDHPIGEGFPLTLKLDELL